MFAKLIAIIGMSAFTTAVFAQNPDSFDIPSPPSASLGNPSPIWFTRYLIATAHALPYGVEILDPAGQSLGARISNRDFCFSALQGTVRVIGPSGESLFNAAGLGVPTPAHCTFRGLSKQSNAKLA